MKPVLHLGVDFDNTIVYYEGVFHAAARTRGLIPEDLPGDKTAVRDYLRAAGREEEWTELQGHVYGCCMDLARPYPGVKSFFRAARESGVAISIVSHKTRTPYRGPAHDLHDSARGWLQAQGFFDTPGIALDPARVHFELTLEEKLRRIAEAGCTHFIDDLPEFLSEPNFPAGVEPILFDPNSRHAAESRFRRLTSWEDISGGCLA